MVGIEQSRSPDDLARAVGMLDGWLRNPEDGDLGLVFRDWLQATVRRMARQGGRIELAGTLKEATMTIADRAAEWPEQWRREGRREGVARERALLRRQTAVRFGDAVGARIDALIGETEESGPLAEVGELIVRAETGEELVDRVGTLLRQDE